MYSVNMANIHLLFNSCDKASMPYIEIEIGNKMFGRNKNLSLGVKYMLNCHLNMIFEADCMSRGLAIIQLQVSLNYKVRRKLSVFIPFCILNLHFLVLHS